jgi:hypothetical protein
MRWASCGMAPRSPTCLCARVLHQPSTPAPPPPRHPLPNGQVPGPTAYQPTQPLAPLLCAAGAATGDTIWTLTVVDSAAVSAAAAAPAARRLRLEAWELWLCSGGDEGGGGSGSAEPAGAPGGAVFVNATGGFDNRVGVSRASDADPGRDEALTTPLAPDTVRRIDAALARLNATNPGAAAALGPAAAALRAGLGTLPAVAVFQGPSGGAGGGGAAAAAGPAGTKLRVAANSSLEPPQPGDALTTTAAARCYQDLYWCWRNAGVRSAAARQVLQEYAPRDAPLLVALDRATAALERSAGLVEGERPGTWAGQAECGAFHAATLPVVAAHAAPRRAAPRRPPPAPQPTRSAAARGLTWPSSQPSTCCTTPPPPTPPPAWGARTSTPRSASRCC